MGHAAAPGARIVNYGATAGPPERVDLFKLFWKQLRLIGSTMGSPDDFAQMLRFVQDHQMVPLIDAVMPLAEGNAAIDMMRSSPRSEVQVSGPTMPSESSPLAV